MNETERMKKLREAAGKDAESLNPNTPITKAECFDFVNWAFKYLKQVKTGIYLPKLTRISEQNSGKPLDEWFDQWQKQTPKNRHNG